MEAFFAAIERLRTETTEELSRAPIYRKNVRTLEDVQSIIDQVRKSYGTGLSSTSKRLQRLAAGVQIYGSMLDPIVQHHPEHAALIWASLGLILQVKANEYRNVDTVLTHVKVTANYSQALTEILKAITRIADRLPRFNLVYSLYPTESMRELYFKLLTEIVSFLRRVISWYKQTSIRRVIPSFTRPFQLHYTDIMTRIQNYASEVDKLAVAASQAEARAMSTMTWKN